MPGTALDYLEGVYKHVTRLGDRLVRNFENSTNKWPGGDCCVVAYDRVKVASRQVGDATPLPELNSSIFCRLWMNNMEPRDTWLRISPPYRGKGGAGAMAWDGRGKRVDRDRIWAGDLERGAVIQTWDTYDDFLKVQNGDAPRGEGHSFIFRRYVWNGGSMPAGMKVADQGYHKDNTVTKGDWGYWVAANVRCLGADGTYSEPDPYWPGEI
jgi:hypothetical protein